MPYKDPERMRDYQREYKRLRRAGESTTPGQTDLPMSFRLKTAQDVLDLLAEQIQAVRLDEDASTLEKARCIGYLAGVVLKAVELTNIGTRVDALESVLKGRVSA